MDRSNIWRWTACSFLYFYPAHYTPPREIQTTWHECVVPHTEFNISVCSLSSSAVILTFLFGFCEVKATTQLRQHSLNKRRNTNFLKYIDSEPVCIVNEKFNFREKRCPRSAGVRVCFVGVLPHLCKFLSMKMFHFVCCRWTVIRSNLDGQDKFWTFKFAPFLVS